MAAWVRQLADGRLRTGDGRVWTRVDGWLDPDEAGTLVDGGAAWLVEWCSGGRRPQYSSAADLALRELRAEVLGRMITWQRAERLRRKRQVPTVFVAERWREEAGGDMVLFFESGPYPRV